MASEKLSSDGRGSFLPSEISRVDKNMDEIDPDKKPILHNGVFTHIKSGDSSPPIEKELKEVTAFGYNRDGVLYNVDTIGDISESRDEISGNRSTENLTFQETVNQVQPTKEEFDDMLDNTRDLSNVDKKEELFHSIPNLAYTEVDEAGNIVGSERRLLEYDVHNHDNEFSSRQDGAQSPESQTSVLNSSGDDLSRSDVSRIRVRAYSTTEGGDSQESAYQYYHPQRLSGRHSRYTWYRQSSRQTKLIKRYTSSIAGDSATSFSLWHTSRQDKAILCSFALLNLCNMMCLSVMAPFFPSEAQEVGVSTSTIGWIFGSYSLAQLFFSPLCGNLLKFVNARFMFLAGQFFGGSCYALFGLVTYIDTTDSNLLFIVYCFLLRISASLGCTASSTASFALTANNFREQTTTVFGILETFCGLGLTLGPALGGALYDLGGFVLPFAMLGGIMVIMVPVNALLLPSHLSGTDESESSGNVHMTNLLRVPSIVITCLCVSMGGLVWAMLDPILQPHLQQFDVSSSKVGLYFLLMCSFYAVCSPLWGRLCDVIDDSSPMMLIGLILSGVGLLLLGPSWVLGFPDDYGTLWLNVVALIVLGIAVSLAVIPTFDKMLDAAEKADQGEGIELYGMVAGLWGAVYALGDFAGPTLGGFLTEKYGFKACVTYIAYACGALGVVVLCLWLWERCYGPCQMIPCCSPPRMRTKQSVQDERQPLLA